MSRSLFLSSFHGLPRWRPAMTCSCHHATSQPALPPCQRLRIYSCRHSKCRPVDLKRSGSTLCQLSTTSPVDVLLTSGRLFLLCHRSLVCLPADLQEAMFAIPPRHASEEYVHLPYQTWRTWKRPALAFWQNFLTTQPSTIPGDRYLRKAAATISLRCNLYYSTNYPERTAHAFNDRPSDSQESLFVPPKKHTPIIPSIIGLSSLPVPERNVYGFLIRLKKHSHIRNDYTQLECLYTHCSTAEDIRHRDMKRMTFYLPLHIATFLPTRI